MPRVISAIAVATALLVSVTTMNANAEILYRWVDERGQPVHSDRPPPSGIDYEVISTGASLVRKVDGAEGAVPPELESRPGNQFDVVDPGKPAVEKNPELCARARENLTRLETDARIRMRNDQGEVRYLEPEERAIERDKAAAAIETYCDN